MTRSIQLQQSKVFVRSLKCLLFITTFSKAKSIYVKIKEVRGRKRGADSIVINDYIASLKWRRVMATCTFVQFKKSKL